MDLHYQLMRTQSLANRAIAKENAPLGLLPGQPKILECLLDHQELSQRQIADICTIEAATCGSVLARMENAGLIERKRHPDDRRTLFVTLTEQGKAQARQSRQRMRQVDARMLKGFTEEESAQLLLYLRRIQENLQ